MAALTVSEAIWNIHLVGYIQAATVTILVYDSCLTFSQEVSFVWNSRRSTINVLYLLTRYMPFVDTAFLLREHFSNFVGPKFEDACFLTYRLDASLIVIGIGISEIILMIRILVIWEKDRRLMIALPIFFITIWIAVFVFMYYFLQSLHFFTIPLPGHVTRCYGTKNSTMLLIAWALFMAFEIVMLGLLLIKSIRRYSLSQHMPLFCIVYRDGIIFYLYIVAISACNVIVAYTLPSIALALTPLGRVMHSILTTRFVLELRQVLNKLDDNQGEVPISTDMLSVGVEKTENGLDSV